MLLHVFVRLAVFNLTGHLHGFAVITEEEESHTDAHGGNRSEEVRWWWWGGAGGKRCATRVGSILIWLDGGKNSNPQGC